MGTQCNSYAHRYDTQLVSHLILILICRSFQSSRIAHLAVPFSGYCGQMKRRSTSSYLRPHM